MGPDNAQSAKQENRQSELGRGVLIGVHRSTGEKRARVVIKTEKRR
jgi:hypothetical protein